MNKRAHIYYEGRVQGVGFRFTAKYIARELGITGWAKNLPDGRVEVVAEGSHDLLDKFISNLKQKMHSCIDNEIIDISPHKSELKDFSVRF